MTDTQLVPINGVVMPLKTKQDWASFFHQLTPIICTAFVAAHMVTNDQVTLWVPMIWAILDPILSATNSTDKVRTIIYSLFATLQTGNTLSQVLQVGIDHSNTVVAPYITAGGAILSGVLGTFFTPTPSSIKAIPSTQS